MTSLVMLKQKVPTFPHIGFFISDSSSAYSALSYSKVSIFHIITRINPADKTAPDILSPIMTASIGLEGHPYRKKCFITLVY